MPPLEIDVALETGLLFDELDARRAHGERGRREAVGFPDVGDRSTVKLTMSLLPDPLLEPAPAPECGS